MNHRSETFDIRSVSTAKALPASNYWRPLPLFLLALWIANLAVFFVYFIKLGWTELR